MTCLGSNCVDQAQRTFPTPPQPQAPLLNILALGGSWNPSKLWGYFFHQLSGTRLRLESKLSYREEKNVLHRPEFMSMIEGREGEQSQGWRRLRSGCGERVWILLDYQTSTAGRVLRTWFSAWAKAVCSDDEGKWGIADQRDTDNKALC